MSLFNNKSWKLQQNFTVNSNQFTLFQLILNTNTYSTAHQAATRPSTTMRTTLVKGPGGISAPTIRRPWNVMPHTLMHVARRSLNQRELVLVAVGHGRRSPCQLVATRLARQLLWSANAISNDLERIIILFSRSHHSLTLNISQTATDTAIVTIEGE